MTDQIELLEAVMNCLLEGVVIFGDQGEVLFSNQPAEAILGYASSELEGRSVPETLRLLRLDGTLHVVPQTGHGALVCPRHKLGHDVPIIARTMVLQNQLGERIGLASFFHPAERLDALPHGETAGDREVGESLLDVEDRLRIEFEDFQRGGPPFGVLWISIDQAAELRKTHGVGACQAMIEKVQHALTQGLRPGEEVGRWGDDEFLIAAHERTPEMLAVHARTLAGLARTADFRWWGDRVSLTVSIGVAQVRRELNETLSLLLDRARAAMEISVVEGGNRITSVPKHFRAECAARSAAPLELSEEGRSDSEDAAGGDECLPS